MKIYDIGAEAGALAATHTAIGTLTCTEEELSSSAAEGDAFVRGAPAQGRPGAFEFVRLQPKEAGRPSFIPSATLICAARNLLVAMAMEECVRPTVEAYETAILARHQFKPAEQFRQYFDAEYVLDRSHSYLLSKEHHAIFLAECFAARDAQGLKVSRPDNCPLLEAQSLRFVAEDGFLESLSEIQGMDALKGANMSLSLRAKAIDLGLRLVVPYVGNAADFIGRYAPH